MKLLARHIIFDGRDYGLSTLFVSDDRTRIEIQPFEQETHSTQYVEGTLHIHFSDNKYMIFSDFYKKYL